MHVAIGIGVLLLGGWVLPPIDPVADQPDAMVDPRLNLWPDSPPARPEARPPDARRSSPGQGGRAAEVERQQRPRQMPAPPTGPLAESTVSLGTPTGDFAPGYGGLGQQSTAVGSSTRATPYRPPGSTSYRSPGSPALRRPGPSFYGPPGASRTDPYRRSAAVHAPRAGTASKPFAGYRMAPAISPYLNLYRTDNALGTVDNYYTLVKPLVNQRTANVRFGTQIRGLENSRRRQGTAIKTLDRETRALQGTTTPQYYQNYGNYYPGFQR